MERHEVDARRLLETLVPQVTPNATVVSIDERGLEYRVTIAGTTGVVARCELPRQAVEAAVERDDARRRLSVVLKRCADSTVAPVPDGRA